MGSSWPGRQIGHHLENGLDGRADDDGVFTIHGLSPPAPGASPSGGGHAAGQSGASGQGAKFRHGERAFRRNGRVEARDGLVMSVRAMSLLIQIGSR